jgi:hypothetical protein
VTYFVNPLTSVSRSLVNASLIANAQGELAAFSDGQVTGTLGAAIATDVGSNSAAGNLHWGMWPTAIVGGAPATFLHYIVGDAPSLPGTGIFTYRPIGGTAPTNGLGVTGTFLGGTVTVNFPQSSLQLNNWQVAFNGASYVHSGAVASFGRSTAFSSQQMSWTCTGQNCGASPISGNFAGSFTGAGAPGMGIAYVIPDTGLGGNGQIIGVQGFKR